MDRSPARLKRITLGLALATVFGFGATQAFATDPLPMPQPTPQYCIVEDPEWNERCNDYCWEQFGRPGWCHMSQCNCNWY